ncbi:DinB family protein [Paenibacillus protaetiae]|uniref:Damage-inducible protein DinB n=1 Tax=Paenibacillus protaetiae TaxID=2509456 RepID=A0A4P6EZF4_9BACL|nr:DinB family protein [Paenibacillus protaetiae]QAY67199.1 damage-inducible protein DinB [Paenibacillus protaetiae]
MLAVVQQQYDWIKAARNSLFAFMEEMPIRLLHQPVPGFGHRTMIQAHLHVVGSYRFWLDSFAFRKLSEHKDTATDEIERADVRHVRSRFAEADDIVERFLTAYSDRLFEPIIQSGKWQGYPQAPTPLLLLNHVQTHEFHHKGQIVMLARQLGFPPPADDRLGGLFT